MSPRFDRRPDKRMGTGGRGSGSRDGTGRPPGRPPRFSGPKPEWKLSGDGGAAGGGGADAGVHGDCGLVLLLPEPAEDPTVSEPEEKPKKAAKPTSTMKKASKEVKKLQDKTKGFNTFIPLKFRNENNEMSDVKESGLIEDRRESRGGAAQALENGKAKAG